MARIQLAQLLTPLTDEIEGFYLTAEQQLAEMLPRCNQQIGHEPTCHGCTSAGCCYQKVMTNLVEVLPLVRHLRQTGQQQPALRAQLRHVGERMEGVSPEAWFDLAIPCPFLVERRCSIYAYRPWVCRAHHAWSVAEICSPPTRGETVTLVADLGQAQAQLFFNLQTGLQRTLGLGTERAMMATLPRMTAIVLEALAQSATDPVPFFSYLFTQPYPRLEHIREWAYGANPFRPRLTGPSGL